MIWLQLKCPRMGGVRWWGACIYGLGTPSVRRCPFTCSKPSYQPRKLSRKKGGVEEVGWYYFCPWGSHKPLVTCCPSSIKQWKESWFWVSGNWQRVFDDPEPELDAPSVYGIASE
ncbi:Uncharacterized protein Adt_03985 [Abeliophyllum distichum]|uniref:Uncharacterized protein n=1 Tax=Abeliophyllum distichum TaxID=126358 RepID=A0ABD1W0C7_9LAMI